MPLEPKTLEYIEPNVFLRLKRKWLIAPSTPSPKLATHLQTCRNNNAVKHLCAKHLHKSNFANAKI